MIDLGELASDLSADEVSALAFHPSGDRIAVGVGKEVLEIELASRTIARRVSFVVPSDADGDPVPDDDLAPYVDAVTYEAGGELLAATCYGAVSNNDGFRVIDVWRPKKKEPLVVPDVLDFEFDTGNDVRTFAIDARGRVLAAAREDLTVRITQIADGAEHTLEDPAVAEAGEEGIKALLFDGAGDRLAIVHWHGVVVVRVANGAVEHTITLADEQRITDGFARWLPNGIVVATGELQKTAYDKATPVVFQIPPKAAASTKPFPSALLGRRLVWSSLDGASHVWAPARYGMDDARLFRHDVARAKAQAIANRRRAKEIPLAVAASDGKRFARAYGTRIALSHIRS